MIYPVQFPFKETAVHVLAIDALYGWHGAVHGLQVGISNQAEKVKGFQIGLVNSSGSLQGLQIGLANQVRNRKGPGAWMPIVNVGF